MKSHQIVILWPKLWKGEGFVWPLFGPCLLFGPWPRYWQWIQGYRGSYRGSFKHCPLPDPQHTCSVFVFLDIQSTPDEPGLSQCFMYLSCTRQQGLIPNPCTPVCLLHFSRDRPRGQTMLPLPSVSPRRSPHHCLTVATGAILHLNSYCHSSLHKHCFHWVCQHINLLIYLLCVEHCSSCWIGKKKKRSLII